MSPRNVLCLLIAIVQISSISTKTVAEVFATVDVSATVNVDDDTIPSETTIDVIKIYKMSTKMRIDALMVLAHALDTERPCETWSDYFQEAYPEYDWHAIEYDRKYYIRRCKSITVSVNDSKYVLFATNL